MVDVLPFKECMEVVDNVHSDISDKVLVDIDRLLGSIQLIVLFYIWQRDVLLEDLTNLVNFNFAELLFRITCNELKAVFRLKLNVFGSWTLVAIIEVLYE